MRLVITLNNDEVLEQELLNNWYFICHIDENNFYNNCDQCLAICNNKDPLINNKNVLKFYQKLRMLDKNNIKNIQIFNDKVVSFTEQNEVLEMIELNREMKHFDMIESSLKLDHIEFLDQHLSNAFQSQFSNGILFLFFFNYII